MTLMNKLPLFAVACLLLAPAASAVKCITYHTTTAPSLSDVTNMQDCPITNGMCSYSVDGAPCKCQVVCSGVEVCGNHYDSNATAMSWQGGCTTCGSPTGSSCPTGQIVTQGTLTNVNCNTDFCNVVATPAQPVSDLRCYSWGYDQNGAPAAGLFANKLEMDCSLAGTKCLAWHVAGTQVGSGAGATTAGGCTAVPNGPNLQTFATCALQETYYRANPVFSVSSWSCTECSTNLCNNVECTGSSCDVPAGGTGHGSASSGASGLGAVFALAAALVSARWA